MFSWLKKLKISQKLTISFLLLGIFSVLLVSVIFYEAFKAALIDRTSAQLSSINVLKKAQLEDYFKSRKRIFEIFLHNKEVLDLLTKSGQEEQSSDQFNQIK